MTTHQHRQYLEEERNAYEQRNRDIDLYGYAGAFKRDSRMSFEKYEINKLRGEE